MYNKTRSCANLQLIFIHSFIQTNNRVVKTMAEQRSIIINIATSATTIIKYNIYIVNIYRKREKKEKKKERKIDR
jgi:hypothetical protein